MFKLILSLLLMINATTISAKLQGLVGFRNSYNPAYAVLDAQNLTSRSGLIINDNPFVKLESVKDSMDYPEITDANFNIFLRDKVASSAINVINEAFSAEDYIDRQLIYKNALNKFSQVVTPHQSGSGNYVNAYDIPSGFNCYWLQPSKEKNIAFVIKRVLLEFNGTGNLKLYLYNTADLTTPLATKTVDITGPFQEVTLDWVCDNSAGKGYKGDYYLGYFQEECDASLQPFKREYREAVLMSEIDRLVYWRTRFANFQKQTDPFDLMGYSTYMFYNGVNPDITVFEDFTDMIVQNEMLFARAIQLAAQIDLISETIATIRSNRNERLTAQYAAQLLVQIEGESGENNVKVKGLKPQYNWVMNTLKKEINKLRFGYTGEGQIVIETLS